MRIDAPRAANAAAAGKMLVVTDPPRHTQMRSTMSSVFTPRSLDVLTGRMRSEVARSLDLALEAGDCDLVSVAGDLPVRMICWLMGIPEADHPRLLSLTKVVFRAPDEQTGSVHEQTLAHAEILSYYEELAAERRREPRDDLVSMLAAGLDGTPEALDSFLLNCDGLLTGGNETTRHAMVGGILALLEHPDQLRRLRADPSLLRSATEEIIRWTSPAVHMMRTAREDLHLHDVRIRRGDRVALWNSSANRDERAFTDPDSFDIAPHGRRHVAFGVGAHFCLGAELARREIAVFTEALLSRVRTMEVTGEVVPTRSTFVRGIERLPMRLSAA